MTTLYAVPSDDVSPYPVDFHRLVTHVRDLGYDLDIIVEGRAAGAIFDSVPFHLSLDSSGRFLSIRAIWSTDLPYSAASETFFAAADSWNREKYFPTLYSIANEDHTTQVCGDFVVDVSGGLSNEQLTHNIHAGISTGLDAIDYMREASVQALSWVNSHQK